MEKPERGKVIATYHMSINKATILKAIETMGAKEALVDFEGTDEEAIAWVKDSPRQHFTFGDCDNQAPDGSCMGHKPEESNQ